MITVISLESRPLKFRVFIDAYSLRPQTLFPVVANTGTKSIQKQIKSIDVDKVGSNKKAQNMRGFDHETILSPSFHGVRKERLAQLPSICDPNTTKKVRGTSRKIGWGCAARFLKPLL